MTAIAHQVVTEQNCAVEPIHTPGSVQSHGCILVAQRGQGRVSHASENADRLLTLRGRAAVGRDVSDILGARVVTELTAGLADQADGLPRRLFGQTLPGSDGVWDVAVHEYGAFRIFELEPASSLQAAAPLDIVRNVLVQLQQARTLRDLCDHTVEIVRDLIGFDRVMVYRFLEDGAGHVIAESRAPGLEPLMNLRYPASDIPVQARELYKKSWIRLIADVDAAPSPLAREPHQTADGPVDLSFAILRSVSPIHIEYLRNMGVGASMSISVIVGGELWGLIACHSKAPRVIPANVRVAAELLGQVFSLQIQTVEGIEAYVTMRAARALLDRIVAEFPVEGDLVENIAQRLEPLSAFIASDGVGIWMDGIWRSFGTVPSVSEVQALATHLGGLAPSSIFATQALGDVYPAAAAWRANLCGLLSIPLSHSGRDYLMFFRKEVAQTVDWGGNPGKAMEAGEGGRLTPRKSFELWREQVRGRSLPWTSRERLIADTLRIYLVDVVVRFSDVILDERRKAQQTAKLITSELNTRVKGTLELIQSLVARGIEEQTVSDFVRTLEGRIGAISLAHSAISSGEGSGVSTLIETALSAVAPASGRIDLMGPDIRLDAKAYTVLALVVHELATNAARYGSLSTPQGQLAVHWRHDAQGGLTLEWDEAGGLPMRTPWREGLGMNIIRHNIPHSLGGEAQVIFERSGLKCSLSIPARYIITPAGTPQHPSYAQIGGNTHRLLEGFSLMVLDDQMLTAMSLQKGLTAQGAVAVDIAGTLEKAFELIAVKQPDAAVLDVDLDGESSMAVADELERLSIPFVFMANEIDRAMVAERFADIAVVSKPCSVVVLAEAIREVLMPQLIRAVLTKLV